jgi:predicted dehydrogenase
MALRFAILGAARIAGPALITPAADQPDVVITAVGASSLDRAREFAVTHQIGFAGTYEEAITRDDVDVVYIALPPSAHAPWTVKALEAGKHVFLEKPATTTLEEAESIVAAAEKAGKRLIEAFHYRWHPLFLRALEIVRSGTLGTLLTAQAEFSATIPRNETEFRWRADLGGGALADLGCYPVSWLRQLAGQEPDVTQASQIREPNGVDRFTRATLSFPSGLRGEIITDAEPPEGGRRNYLTLVGDKGHLHIVNPLAPQYDHEMILTIGGVETRERFPRRTTFAYQLDGVVEAILRTEPVATEGADILGNARTMAEIRRVAAQDLKD